MKDLIYNLSCANKKYTLTNDVPPKKNPLCNRGNNREIGSMKTQARFKFTPLQALLLLP